MSDDISKSLDHRIRIKAIFGTLGETVAFSASSPHRHDWFAKLVYLADQPCMCTPIGLLVAMEHAVPIICSC